MIDYPIIGINFRALPKEDLNHGIMAVHGGYVQSSLSVFVLARKKVRCSAEQKTYHRYVTSKARQMQRIVALNVQV
jgi:hypothetical protein